MYFLTADIVVGCDDGGRSSRRSFSGRSLLSLQENVDLVSSEFSVNPCDHSGKSCNQSRDACAAFRSLGANSLVFSAESSAEPKMFLSLDLTKTTMSKKLSHLERTKFAFVIIFGATRRLIRFASLERAFQSASFHLYCLLGDQSHSEELGQSSFTFPLPFLVMSHLKLHDPPLEHFPLPTSVGNPLFFASSLFFHKKNCLLLIVWWELH